LGLEVHEEPRLARGQKQRLVPGNVITIEPGVYIPGVGGIRIEDDVAVLARGIEVLTSVPRELIEI
jgi:Xaa-Pro aminopeptidase